MKERRIAICIKWELWARNFMQKFHKTTTSTTTEIFQHFVACHRFCYCSFMFFCEFFAFLLVQIDRYSHFINFNANTKKTFEKRDIWNREKKIRHCFQYYHNRSIQLKRMRSVNVMVCMRVWDQIILRARTRTRIKFVKHFSISLTLSLPLDTLW